MTVTLGPFFFSSAVEGPGNSRKKTEAAMRAAANSTFMFRSKRRSIHRGRERGPGSRGPEEGGDASAWAPAPPPRAAGGNRGSCPPPGGGGPYFPPLGRRRVVGPRGGRGPARRQGRPGRGLVGGCHVTVASLAPQLASARQQEKDHGRRHRPEEHADWVSEETTNPSMQSGPSRGPPLGRGSPLEGWFTLGNRA